MYSRRSCPPLPHKAKATINCRAPVVCLATVPVPCLDTAAVPGGNPSPTERPPRARSLVLGHRFCLVLGHSSRAGGGNPPPRARPLVLGHRSIYLFLTTPLTASPSRISPVNAAGFRGISDQPVPVISPLTWLTSRFPLQPNWHRALSVQGWCAGLGVETEMNEAWQQREEARRRLRAEPHNSNLRKAVKMAGKNLRRLPC